MNVKEMMLELVSAHARDHELSPYFVCIHKNLSILAIDEGGSQLLGYKDPFEIVGKSIFSFLADDNLEAVHERIDFIEKGLSLSPIIMKFLINGVPMDLELESEQTFYNGEPAIKTILRFLIPLRKNHDLPNQATPLILNSNKGIIITTPDGSILSISESFTRLTGFSSNEVIGKNPRMWQSQSYTAVFYKKMWISLLANGCWQGELWNKRRDGSHYLMKVNIYSIGDQHGKTVNYMAVYTDLTELEKLAQKLKDNEEQYRFLAENSSDMIGRLSSEGNILYISSACQLILGYQPGELTETNIADHIHPEDLTSLLNEYGEPELFSGIATFSFRMKHRNGHYIWAETTVRSLKDQAGRQTGMMFATRDVTARTKIETQLRESNMLLRKISSLDGLTEIYNRRAFDEFLDTEWAFACEHGSIISLLLIDIDYFKKFNDRYGHIEGDECLKLVARTLEGFFQEKGFYAARYGGEEFAVILPNTDRVKALSLAETFREKIQSLRQANIDSKVSDYVTVSIGLSSMSPERENNLIDIIQLADQALYKAKQNGRNRTEIC